MAKWQMEISLWDCSLLLLPHCRYLTCGAHIILSVIPFSHPALLLTCIFGIFATFSSTRILIIPIHDAMADISASQARENSLLEDGDATQRVFPCWLVNEFMRNPLGYLPMWMAVPLDSVTFSSRLPFGMQDLRVLLAVDDEEGLIRLSHRRQKVASCYSCVTPSSGQSPFFLCSLWSNVILCWAVDSSLTLFQVIFINIIDQWDIITR